MTDDFGKPRALPIPQSLTGKPRALPIPQSLTEVKGTTTMNEPAPQSGRPLTKTQATVLYNHWMKGLSEDFRAFLPAPDSISHPEQGMGQTSVYEKMRVRSVCQFLRDMADSLDPEGPLVNRMAPEATAYSELAGVCLERDLTIEQCIQLVKDHG